MLGEAGSGDMYVAKGLGRENSMKTIAGGRVQTPKAILSGAARAGRAVAPTSASSGETEIAEGRGRQKQM